MKILPGFWEVQDGLIIADQQKLKIDYMGVDAPFFDIFSFPLLKGRSEEVLQTPNSIVLSRSMAIKLFGSLDVIGKTVLMNTEHKFLVTGIMEDFPERTHFVAQDALVNLKAFEDLWGFTNLMEAYGFASLSIYFLAKENSNLPAKSQEVLDKFNKDLLVVSGGVG